MEDYIIIPKKKEEETTDNKNALIHRQDEKDICFNCNQKHKYTLSFGRGVNTVKVKLCRDCLKEYKDRLDKEFGNTFWGTVGKMIKKQERELKVSYYNGDDY